MANLIDIANKALIQVGARVISSLTEDCREAALVNAIFIMKRDEVLRDGCWNFAIVRTTPTREAICNISSYLYAYILPVDCVKVLSIDDDATDYIVEGRTLYTNLDEIELRYISNIIAVEFWDASFCDALALSIATEICYSLTNSTERAVKLYEMYSASVRKARFLDSTEGKVPSIISDDWTNSRL